MLRLALSCTALAASAMVVPTASAREGCTAGAVETRHSITIAGKRLDYIACVGRLAVPDKTGRVTAQIGYTAYLVPGGAARRPLAFVWNGGPGADSRTLQFHAVGPKVFRQGGLVDNPASPLAVSDLVFVDPVGTGFSTADKPAAFYGTTADIAATGAFIVRWRKAYRRERSALDLVGESFGTWRASGVAAMLAGEGVPVAGVALISGGIPLGEEAHPERRRALSLVNRAATAFALHRLDAALMDNRARTLAEVRQWAETVYAPALADPGALGDDQRRAVVSALARYQGLQPEQIDAKTLWLSPRSFRTALVPGQTLGLFDMRRTGAADTQGEDAAALDYYRHDLGYRQGRYAGIETPDPHVGEKWQYDQSPVTPESLARAMAGEGPPSASRPWIVEAMRREPGLRVWVAAGLYDSLNSCIANEQAVAALPPAIARRFTLECYEGGHMMYDDPDVAPRFGRDLAAFLDRQGDLAR